MFSHRKSKTALAASVLLCTMAGASAALAESTNDKAREKNKFAVPVREISDKQKIENAKTAKSINKIPGVNLTASDLQPPAQDPPIKGFHPIKRALAPVVALEKNSVQLQQQIMKLEGPISALQPAMNSLHGKLDNVDNRMHSVDGHITTMDEHVEVVSEQMKGVRGDLTHMRSDLGELQAPLHSLLGPLNNVAKPLEEVRGQLADMRAMLAAVLFAIVASTVGIAIGTPLVAILMYKYRHKLFPQMSEHDFPVVADASRGRELAHHPLEK